MITITYYIHYSDVCKVNRKKIRKIVQERSGCNSFDFFSNLDRKIQLKRIAFGLKARKVVGWGWGYTMHLYSKWNEWVMWRIRCDVHNVMLTIPNQALSIHGNYYLLVEPHPIHCHIVAAGLSHIRQMFAWPDYHYRSYRIFP